MADSALRSIRPMGPMARGLAEGTQGSDRALPPCGGTARAARPWRPVRQGLATHDRGTTWRWPSKVGCSP
jgi:hypothetical protein